MESTARKKSLDRTNVSFSELVRIFVGRIWILLLLSVLGAFAAFTITYVTVPKTYKATARIYINNSTVSIGNSTSISVSDLSASSNLVPTYSNLVKAEYHMLDTVVEKYNTSVDVEEQNVSGYTATKLKSMIDCKEISKTSYLDISVTSKNPSDSVLLANLIVDVLPGKVNETIDGSSISLVDPAVKAVEVSRGLTKKTFYGFVIGFVLAAMYVFFRYVIFDDRIDNEEWLKKYFGEEYPLLTVVPDMDVTTKHGYGYYVKRGYYGYYEKTEEQNENK